MNDKICILTVISVLFDVWINRAASCILNKTEFLVENVTRCILAYCYRRSVCLSVCPHVRVCACVYLVGGSQENGFR